MKSVVYHINGVAIKNTVALKNSVGLKNNAAGEKGRVRVGGGVKTFTYTHVSSEYGLDERLKTYCILVHKFHQSFP